MFGTKPLPNMSKPIKNKSVDDDTPRPIKINDSELYQLISKLQTENDNLKDQTDLAKKIQKDILDGLTIEKVIKVRYRTGLGTKENKTMINNTYWDINGNYLFTIKN